MQLAVVIAAAFIVRAAAAAVPSQPQLQLQPTAPAANSQISFSPAPLAPANYSLTRHARELCRFETSLVPCGCVMRSGEGLQLRRDDQVILTNISIGAPRVSFALPKEHEMLHELTITITPDLCLEQTFTLALSFRPLEVMPFDDSPWSVVFSLNVSLHDRPFPLVLPCEIFHRLGLYSLRATSSEGDVIETDRPISVTSGGLLSLRAPPSPSIFPACTADLTLHWTPPACRPADLSHRMRILAVDPKHKGESYIEETMLESGSTSSFSLPCSFFDIYYLQYCFELVSIHAPSHSFHQWASLCISTEPRVEERAEWSEWSEWSACSSSCGKGLTRRTRSCSVHSSSACPPGDVSQTTECTTNHTMATTDCAIPNAQSLSSPSSSNSSSSSCLCGCLLTQSAASLFIAPARAAALCEGLKKNPNQTTRRHLAWRIPARGASTRVDAVVTVERVAEGYGSSSAGRDNGRLLIYRGAAYERLEWTSWKSEHRRTRKRSRFTLTLSLRTDLTVVYEPPLGDTVDEGGEAVWSLHYTISEAHSPALSLLSPSSSSFSLLSCSSPSCLLPLLGLLLLILLALLTLPPLICAALTRRSSRARERKRTQDEAALLSGSDVDPMLRSGNTECTQVSIHRTRGGADAPHAPASAPTRMVPAKRSIGIQLSVTSTPRLHRHFNGSSESPLTTARGGSSLSNMEELEYDEYDGALMPGSLFRPLELTTDSIDIDQIIAEAERVVGGVEVERATAGTQADRPGHG